MTQLTDEARENTGPFDSYADRMAYVLHSLDLDGMSDDTVATDNSGSGASRIGRRVLMWDEHGRLASHRFATEAEAVTYMGESAWNEDDEDG